ncbi:MAG: response regulator [Candidatus Omnitrophica bacterium]|nr:response regulator [Candidatus Omnitrophota bacterium]
MAGEKILLVDDEKNQRESFAASFDEYEVITAINGEEALDIFMRPNDIDLVVADMMMPGLTGTELIRKIKNIKPGQKTILMTGHSTKEVAIEALRSNADDYLEKPYDIGKAKEVFEALLRKGKGQGKEKDILNMTISAEEVVKKYSLSYQTVNYYTNLGLFVVAGTKRNKRYYDADQIEARIKEINALRLKGYSLKAIRGGFDR